MSRLSRRGILGSVAALVPVAATSAAVPAVQPPDLDAAIHTLCAKFHALNHEASILPEEGPRTWEQAQDERWDVSDQLEGMRPRTMEGRLAKAGVALALMEENTSNGAMTDGSTDDFVLATLRDVVGISPGRLVGDAPPSELDAHPSQMHTFLAIKGGMPDPVFERWLEGGLRIAARHKGETV